MSATGAPYSRDNIARAFSGNVQPAILEGERERARTGELAGGSREREEGKTETVEEEGQPERTWEGKGKKTSKLPPTGEKTQQERGDLELA